MRLLRLFLLFGLLAVIADSSPANADGLFSRLRAKSRAVTPARQYVSPSRNYSTRNLNQGRRRLPAGRSYYQGRYYGNFNNRFYGPQYGYF